MDKNESNGSKIVRQVNSLLSSAWSLISIVGVLVTLVVWGIRQEGRIAAVEHENGLLRGRLVEIDTTGTRGAALLDNRISVLEKRVDNLDAIANQAIRLDTPIGKIVTGMNTKLDTINERENQINANNAARLDEVEREERRANDRTNRIVSLLDTLYDQIQQILRQMPPPKR